VLSSLWGFAGLPLKRLPALMLLMMSGECCGGKMYFPKEGYQVISDILVKKVIELGGEIRYKTAVTKILIQGKNAVGMETATEETVYAGVVVSNTDTKKTFLELGGRKHLSRKHYIR
jgi:phytoene dehydrogenase-like protein